MTKNQPSLQDDQLTQIQEKKLHCTIITKNGVQMQGTIVGHDKYVILFLSKTGIQSLIYKHAISTIK
ncbi:RNA-binding protein Hfq [compost metagenome]